jgi:hypothetical protein
MKTILVLALVVLVVAAIAYAQVGPRIRAEDNPKPPPGLLLPPPPVIMLADGGFLYILRGDQLIKIEESTLEAKKVMRLPRPEPPPPED